VYATAQGSVLGMNMLCKFRSVNGSSSPVALKNCSQFGPRHLVPGAHACFVVCRLIAGVKIPHCMMKRMPNFVLLEMLLLLIGS
jgi:hypothetical protein